MNIKIDLEDNRLCKGCPANTYLYAKCSLGHIRTNAIVLEKVLDPMYIHNGGPAYCEFARPITCFMQSDSLEQIPETNAKPISKPVGQVIALPYTPPEVPTPNANDILP